MHITQMHNFANCRMHTAHVLTHTVWRNFPSGGYPQRSSLCGETAAGHIGTAYVCVRAVLVRVYACVCTCIVCVLMRVWCAYVRERVRVRVIVCVCGRVRVRARVCM
jgi:hypothetical protein